MATRRTEWHLAKPKKLGQGGRQPETNSIIRSSILKNFMEMENNCGSSLLLKFYLPLVCVMCLLSVCVCRYACTMDPCGERSQFSGGASLLPAFRDGGYFLTRNIFQASELPGNSVFSFSIDTGCRSESLNHPTWLFENVDSGVGTPVIRVVWPVLFPTERHG